jgi:ribonuclease-3
MKKSLEEILEYKFRDPDLLKGALTHSSAGGDKNYERLEFLGDRVIGLAIAELLFVRFPKEQEGDLAKRLAALAQGELIAEIAVEMGLGPHVILSNAESLAGGAANVNILSDVFESIMGALYLDGGYKKCEQLIHKLWERHLDNMKAPPQHPKTALQEWAQAKGLPLPIYKIQAQRGPDHAPVFVIELSVQGFDTVLSEGPSRQEAEKRAAHAFMEREGQI